jgi:hypothetical protein
VKKGVDQADKVVIGSQTLACNEVDNEDQGGYAGSLKPFVGKRLLPEYGYSLGQG